MTSDAQSSIPVGGYARISDESDKDETSIANQKKEIEEYCQEHGYKLAVCGKDRNVSGSTDPFNRDGFNEVFQVLQENEEINIVLVRKGDRLWRGKPVSRIERDLQIRLERPIDFIKVNPSGAEEMIDEMKEADSPTRQAIAKGMESQLSMAEEMKVAKAEEEGKRIAAERRQKNLPFHRPPRGITTDKQKHDHISNATEWVPLDDAEKTYNQFETCISMLNEMATTDKSPYQVGKEFGVPNPDRKMKKLRENKDIYREVAEQYRPKLSLKF